MAINSVVLEIVVKIAQQLPRPCRMLCLGYPDMLVTEAQIAALCGEAALPRLAYREDSESILRWHGLTGQMQRIAETRSVFASLGVECDFVDIVAARGVEILVDLNGAPPADLLSRYDLVYDGGTMEHCFNVGQVMRNILAFARTGGFIVHVNPLNRYNHGFFNFSPTFYHDWYSQSGNALASPLYAMHGPVLASRIAPLEPTQGFAAAPESSVLVVAAQKVSAAEPAWPMQTKYLRKSAPRS